MERLTRRYVEELLTRQAPDDEAFVEEAMRLIDSWLDRGDGVAVYRHEDMSDPIWLGHCKFVSYGSERAQLEVAEPPKTLPDIGTDINWRYQLLGVYRVQTEHLKDLDDVIFPEFD